MLPNYLDMMGTLTYLSIISPLIYQCGSTLVGLCTGVVPASRVAMDTSLLALNHMRPPTNSLGTSSQTHLLTMSSISFSKLLYLVKLNKIRSDSPGSITDNLINITAVPE